MSTTALAPAADNSQRLGPQEMLRAMGRDNLYLKAAEAGMGLSAWLEREMPSQEYRDGLDAFSRLLMCAGIRTKTDMACGFYADELSAFGKDAETRALFPEWCMRQWRKASTGRSVNTRAIYASDDQGQGTVANPFYDSGVPRVPQLAPAIPLAEMVAITTPITGNVYRAFYLTDTTSQERLVRVAESAELPRAKLTGGQHQIDVFKYGRALEMSYEMLRRQRIDMVALHISRLAIQAETDKVATVLDIMVNGDGNASTAATSSNLTTIDTAASAGTLTLKGWLGFKLLFLNPYAVTTALVQSAGALQLMLLNVGSANVPLVAIQAQSGFGGFTPINPELRDNVALGITSAAPTLKVVAFDRRFAIERVYEIGANIQEIDKFILNQTQILTFSEGEGYAVLDQQATRILDINA